MDTTSQPTPPDAKENSSQQPLELLNENKNVFDGGILAKQIREIENTQLLRVVEAGWYGKCRYTGLYFSVYGKELFYALSDWMLHKLIKDFQGKCITPDSVGKSSQIHETSDPSPF